MSNFLKRKIANLIDTRKYDWIWEKISDTYFGYYLRKSLMAIMGISEEFAIRDIVSEGRDFVLKTTYSDSKERFNVLLVQLPLPSNRKHKRILPMGLASLAGFLRTRYPEINVGILDAQCQNMNFDQVIEQIKKVDWNIIGISYWTVQAKFAARLSKKIKSLNQNVVVVHGGVHATVLPEEALKTADFAVLHEGEETFAELIGAIKDGKAVDKVRGIAYLKDGKIHINETRPLMDSLDDLPRPAYDLLPVERYKMPLHVVGGDRLPVMGSRGCPYSCSFCTSPNLWQGRVRWRSGSNVVDEIEWLMKEYNVKKFHFWDDNFTLNPKFVRELCTEVEKRKLRIAWVALDRAEHINRNRNLLPLMKKSGCIGIELGLESANPDTFVHISKDQGIDESKRAIQNLRSNNLYPLYTCMVFNPGESIIGYYMQKEFLDKAQEGYPWHKFFHPFSYPVYIGQFATPYPKTKFFESIEKESLVLLEDEEDRYHHQINSVPYSLLKDVPVRNVDKLDEELYIIFLNAVKIGFWSYFQGNDNREELGRKLHEIWKFVLPYFRKCSGNLPMHQIGKELSEELSMPFNKAMRLTAYATYIFAQVGAIRSAVYYRDYAVKRKHVRIPLTIKKDIKCLLELAGVSPQRFVE